MTPAAAALPYSLAMHATPLASQRDRDPAAAAVRAGWWLVAFTLIIPLLGLAAIAVGVVAMVRGRLGHGAAILVAGVLAGLFAAGFWTALLA